MSLNVLRFAQIPKRVARIQRSQYKLKYFSLNSGSNDLNYWPVCVYFNLFSITLGETSNFLLLKYFSWEKDLSNLTHHLKMSQTVLRSTKIPKSEIPNISHQIQGQMIWSTDSLVSIFYFCCNIGNGKIPKTSVILVMKAQALSKSISSGCALFVFHYVSVIV